MQIIYILDFYISVSLQKPSLYTYAYIHMYIYIWAHIKPTVQIIIIFTRYSAK